MELFFLSLYDFFHKRKLLLYSLFAAVLVLLAGGASRIKVEEDLSKFFPNDKKLEKVNQVFKDSRFAEKLVVMVSDKDSTHAPDPEALINFADTLAAQAADELRPYIKKISGEVDQENALKLFDVIYQYLPVFLNDNDLLTLDSITQPEAIKKGLENSYRQLISPAGFALKRIVAKDPIGISKIVFRKLQALQYDQDFELYNNHVFTKDHRFLLMFIEPVYPANDTGNNTNFMDHFDEMIQRHLQISPNISTSYFGAIAIAAGNAKQLRDDTILTVSVMTVLLIFFLLGFLRKISAPLIIMVPVLFGGLFALTVTWIIQGSISVLAIAAGSIVVGIAINYSLHFLSHLKHTGNVREVLKDLVEPMTIGSATTVLAFLSLQFAKASMLSDIGLFAGLSLIGAAACSLIFLPHLLSDTFFQSASSSRLWSLRIPQLSARYNKALIIIIFIFTPVMIWFATDVKFNSDMRTLNYMSPSLKKAESALNQISKYSARSVYIVADGKDLEHALRNNERLQPVLTEMVDNGLLKNYASVSTFIISDSLQQKRIDRWNSFWTDQKKQSVAEALAREASTLKFNPVVSKNFDTLVNRNYSKTDRVTAELFRNSFFGDYITEKNGLTTVVTLAAADPVKIDQVYKGVGSTPHVVAVDKRMLTTLFVDYVHADFTFIVTFTSILVFFVLLIYYGRIELTLITFIPMLITWIWILGAMALLGIEFNIVNVMISTFIFGLGDDYSIFIMDGLIREYKTGQQSLVSIKESIFLSAVTTISGLGVLIFAKHPALKSIAAISIIGIITVVVMSQTLEPFIFRKFISDRTKRKLPPLTLMVTLWSAGIYFLFVTGSFVLTALGLLLKIVPLPGKTKRYIYHSTLSFFMWVILVGGSVTHKVINGKGQYEKPAIVISNHESFIDLLMTIMIHPKVLLLTNNWVWNSPIFGWTVKLADYYPVEFGAEGSVEKLKIRVDEGYSIMIFPEGTRSMKGQIRRFHKGAFYLAEKLDLDIVPLVLHGAGESIPKGDLYIQRADLTMKFLAPIRPDDARFGKTYAEKAKSIGNLFRAEYRKVAAEKETPYHFRHVLLSNFIYKGPVLEWYLKIKLRMENYYSDFHSLVPPNATVLDLGCGYGFLSYLLHFISPQRSITGVDYDKDKIAIAQHGYIRGENLKFVHADISRIGIERHDVIILSDVLHYLSADEQENLLKRCFEKMSGNDVLIVRDGDCDLKNKHGMTRLSEWFSVRLLGFNKTSGKLNFLSGEQLLLWCTTNGMEVERLSQQKFTSNVIFVIRKKGGK